MFLGKAYEDILEELESDPMAYDETINDGEADHQVKAMEIELESMHSSKVWKLVEAPNDIKHIGCKWFYKRKRLVDGNVETFPARGVKI
jgi:hypothetical protein